MGQFLCHIEVVNLDNVFGDCEDLSTTRGGGLAALEVAKPAVAGLLPEDVLIAGASKGLFRMSGAGKADVEAKIWDRLKANDRWGVLQHTTIQVAVAEERPGDFARQSVELTNAIRWRQMRAPTVRYPALEDHGGGVCKIDKIRPASRRHDLPEKNEQSDYTNARREYGKEMRDALLSRILAKPDRPFQAAEDLDQLSAKAGHPLHNKIAVLRFDGNDFGAIARDCNTPELTREFSDEVRKQQSAFFRDLFVGANGTVAEEWYGEKDALRMNVVVYGGDEVTFIVPAWLGWRALRQFYEKAKDWRLPGLNRPLTYAGGIVFCHHNAPIHEIKRIASALADLAKDRAKLHCDGKGNYCAYQVLESFDAIGRDLAGYIEERFGKDNRYPILSFDEIAKIESKMDLWRSKISKRKLHAAAMDILRSRTENPAGDEKEPTEEEKKAKFEKTVKGLFEAKDSGSNEGVSEVGKLAEVLGDSVFVHLLELWDYAEGDNR